MNIAVALVGMCGAGKTSATKIFEDYGWDSIHVGDYVMRELNKRNLDGTPENEFYIGYKLKQEHGQKYFVAKLLPEIHHMLTYTNVVLDAIYSWEEYLFLKDRLDNQVVFLCIAANKKIRYQRLVLRKTRPVSQTEAEVRDFNEINHLSKGGPIAAADYYILNNYAEAVFRNDIISFIQQIS